MEVYNSKYQIENTKIYSLSTNNQIIILDWTSSYVDTQHGQDAVNAVLELVKKNDKSYLIAYINAEGYTPEFLDWLVAEWYTPAYKSGLLKIAHQLGDEFIGNTSAELVSWEDASGVVFKNFDKATTEEEIIAWFGL